METIIKYVKWIFAWNLPRLIYDYLKKFITGRMFIYEVAPGLFQGSKFSSKDYDTLVNLGIDDIIDLEGVQDTLPPNISLYYWPIKDIPELPDLKELETTARWGLERLKEGRQVLVHCAAGHNRSGLVNGRILVLAGFSGKDAVKMIQSKVPGSLANFVFKDYIESL